MIKWVKNKFGGQYDGYIENRRLFILYQNSYGRKLWQIEKANGGRVLDQSGFDCFTLSIAKSLCHTLIKTQGVSPCL